MKLTKIKLQLNKKYVKNDIIKYRWNKLDLFIFESKYLYMNWESIRIKWFIGYF